MCLSVYVCALGCPKKNAFLDVQAGKQIYGYLPCQKHADQKWRLEIWSPGPQKVSDPPPLGPKLQNCRIGTGAHRMLI